MNDEIIESIQQAIDKHAFHIYEVAERLQSLKNGAIRVVIDDLDKFDREINSITEDEHEDDWLLSAPNGVNSNYYSGIYKYPDLVLFSKLGTEVKFRRLNTKIHGDRMLYIINNINNDDSLHKG